MILVSPVEAINIAKLALGARLAQLLAVEEEEECRHDGDDHPGQDHHGGPQPDCQIPVHPHIALLPHVWYPVAMAPIGLSATCNRASKSKHGICRPRTTGSGSA